MIPHLSPLTFFGLTPLKGIESTLPPSYLSYFSMVRKYAEGFLDDSSGLVFFFCSTALWQLIKFCNLLSLFQVFHFPLLPPFFQTYISLPWIVDLLLIDLLRVVIPFPCMTGEDRAALGPVAEFRGQEQNPMPPTCRTTPASPPFLR